MLVFPVLAGQKGRGTLRVPSPSALICTPAFARSRQPERRSHQMPRGCPEKPQALLRRSLRKTYVTTLSFPQMLRLPLLLPLPLRLRGALAGARKK